MQRQVPFEEAITAKYPEQVIIVLAREESGRINPVTLSWTMPTSTKPPMMAFSLAHSRYSLEVVRRAGECVIAYPTPALAEAALFCGTHSGRDTDKLAATRLATIPANVVNCVLLADAAANFECRIAGEFPTGDHVIIAGEIVASHINPDRPGRVYTVAKGYRMAGVIPRSGTER